MVEKAAGHTFWLVPEMGRFWTVPNALSLLRLVLVVPITYLILVDGPIAWIVVLAVVAVLSDWFDGRVARWTHSESEWGKVLDPVADKVGAAVVVLALVIVGRLEEWFLGVVVARDVLIVIGGVFLARRTGTVMGSIQAGKWAVGFIALTVLAALLRADPPVMTVLYVATTAMLAYSLLRYGLRFLQELREHRNTPEQPDAGQSEHPGPAASPAEKALDMDHPPQEIS